MSKTTLHRHTCSHVIQEPWKGSRYAKRNGKKCHVVYKDRYSDAKCADCLKAEERKRERERKKALKKAGETGGENPLELE